MGEKIHAIKSLGQHFLVNKQICTRIIDLIRPEQEDKILEIGPGPGALSSLLAAGGPKKLLLLERDKRFAVHLKSLYPQVSVLQMDALSFCWSKLDKGWKIVGNLPYNIASPLVWDILSQYDGLEKAVFMVQQEVAERICAPEGSRQYGALSVWCQNFSHPVCKMQVSAGSFSPPPKVKSAVVAFKPLPMSERTSCPEELKAILHLFFQKRRKQLGSIIRSSQFPILFQILNDLKIDTSLRPENLSPAQYLLIAESFASWKKLNLN